MADWINPNPINTDPGGDTKYTGFVKAQANFDDIYSKLNVVKKLQSGDTAPSNPATGEFWFDTVNNVLRRYDGAKWAKVNPNIGFKNRIINGDFQIWQRGTSFTFPTGTLIYTADRFTSYNRYTDGQFTVSKSTLSNKNAIRFTVDTPPSDLTLGNLWWGLQYRFEGQHLFDLAINGKDVTISFWFNSNVTGEFSVSLINFTDLTVNIQTYVTSFNYITANTPQKIEITIPLNAVWNPLPKNDNNIGFVLSIGALNQGDFVAPSTNSWIDGVYYTTSTAVNWGATAGNFIEIAELQLEEGSVATDFEQIPFDVQLLRCMRYYEKSFVSSPTEVGGAIHFSVGSTHTIYPFDGGVEFKVPKRVTPTIKFYSTISGNSGVIADMDNAVDVAVRVLAEDPQRIRCVFFDQGTTAVTGGRYRYHYEVDAEL